MPEPVFSPPPTSHAVAFLVEGDELFVYSENLAARENGGITRHVLSSGVTNTVASIDPNIALVLFGADTTHVYYMYTSAGRSSLFKVARADLKMIAEETRKRAVGEGRLDSYDDVLRVLVQAGRFACEDVTGLPWTEVDFPKDVAYARDEVLPELLRQPSTGVGAVS